MARFGFSMKNTALACDPCVLDVPHFSLPPLPPPVLLRRLPADDFDPDTSAGPGWYESSRDLLRGLEVREGTPDEAAGEIWLDACVLA